MVVSYSKQSQNFGPDTRPACLLPRTIFLGKGCPPKPPSYVRAGDWFRHVGQDGAWMWPTPTRTPEVEGEKNYRVERWEGIHLFSEFDNRLDHEKTKRIRAELSHRHTYESPELLTWNQGVKPVYNTTTNSVHHPLGGAHFLKRRYPKEYTGVKTGLTPRCCSWLHG